MKRIKDVINKASNISKNNKTFYINIAWIASIVLFWRIVLEALNQLIVPLIGSYGGVSSVRSGLFRWVNWDGQWYYSIVTRGYQYNPDIAKTTMQNVAFLPGFPALVRIVHDITRLSYTYSGLFTNFILTIGIIYIAYGVVNIFLQKYNKQSIGNPYISNIWPAMIVLCLPTSLFFAAYYSEALLVFCLLMTIYLGLRKKYIVAAIFAGLATGVNPIGVVGAPSLLVMFMQQEDIMNNSLIFIIRQYFLKIIGIGLLSVNGILIFMAYLWYRFNDPLAFYKSESAWGRSSSKNILSNLGHIWQTSYSHIFSLTFFGDAKFEYLINLSDMLVPVLGLAIIIISLYKKVYWLAVYAFVLVLLPISTGSVGSLNRFALGLLPALLFIYTLLSRKIKKFLWLPLGLMATMQIVFTVIFLQNFILYLVG